MPEVNKAVRELVEAVRVIKKACDNNAAPYTAEYCIKETGSVTLTDEAILPLFTALATAEEWAKGVRPVWSVVAHHWTCPKCNLVVGTKDGERYFQNFCDNCSTPLNWEPETGKEKSAKPTAGEKEKKESR